MIASKAIPGALVIGDGNAAHFLNGQGAYAAPAGTTLYDALSSFANSANALTNPSAATLTANTWNVINATSACNAKLPAPSAGSVIGVRIKTSSTSLFTLNPNASENIGPGTNSSRVMWAGESAILVSDGTDWIKVAGVTIPMLGTIRLSATTSGPAVGNGVSYNVLLNHSDADNTGLMVDTANHRLICQRTGKYTFNGVVVWSNLTVDIVRCITGLQVNAAGVSNGEAFGKTGSYPSPPALIVLALTTADHLTLVAYQNASTGSGQDVFGAALGVDAACQISAVEIPQW